MVTVAPQIRRQFEGRAPHVATAIGVVSGVLFAALGGTPRSIIVIAAVATLVTTTLIAAGAFGFPWAYQYFDDALHPERARSVAALQTLANGNEGGGFTAHDIQQTLRTSLRDPGLRIALRGEPGQGLQLLDGTELQEVQPVGLVLLHGEDIGAILPSKNSLRRLPNAVLDAAGPLFEVVRFRFALDSALREVQALRERLRLAGYEERRRLERDLRDDAQQRLVALRMRLRVLQLTKSSDAAINEALGEVVAELALAISDLRQIARGARPGSPEDGLGPSR